MTRKIPPTASRRQAPHLSSPGDLTLHGAVDAEGCLVVIPVVNTLGRRGPLRLRELTAELLASPLWEGFTAAFATFAENYRSLRFSYPSLSSEAPLPAPAVIDRTLKRFANEPEAALLRSQLQRCQKEPVTRVFQGTGVQAVDVAEGVLDLQALNLQQPGLLTPPLAGLLDACAGLLAASDLAVSEQRWMLLRARELASGLHLPTAVAAPGLGQSRATKPSWTGFYSGLAQEQGQLTEILTNPDERLQERLPLTRLASLPRLTTFVLVPDPGAEALLTYLQAVSRWGELLQASYGDEPRWRSPAERQRPQRGGDDDRGFDRWQHLQTLRTSEILGSAWRLLLSRANSRRFYPELHSSVETLTAAWLQRGAAGGALGVLYRYLPSRPIAGGGAVLAQAETAVRATGALQKTAEIRLTPAVPRPEAMSLKAGERKKLQAEPQKLWLKLADLGGVTQLQPRTLARPSASLGAGFSEMQLAGHVLWPHAEVWQLLDLVKTLAALPRFFLTPELLELGSCVVQRSDWETLQWPEDGILRALPAGKAWPQLLAWLTGAVPWPLSPLDTSRRAVYQDKSHAEWQLTLVDSGLSAGRVRLSVRYSVVGSSAEQDAQLHLAQVLQAMQTTRAVPQELNEAFAGLGESLRFEARPYFEVDGQVVVEEEWFNAVAVGQRYMRLPNGITIDASEYAAKTDQFLLRQRVYAKFGSLTFDQLWQVHRQAAEASGKQLLPEEYVEQLSLKVAPVLAQLDQQLAAPIVQMLRQGPLAELSQHLRGYQEDGVAWCYLRLRIGLGLCLADQMGLGKTIQAIALLLALRDSERPSLVVMPKSVLINWQRELARFAPTLRLAVVSEGPPETAADIWLTTYPRLRLGAAWLKETPLQMVVLDEAQAIKNSDSQTAEASSLLQARYRLALSGTPVENHAGELWSLMQWLNPGYLGRAADFLNYIKIARSSEQKAMLLAPLRACLEPVMLRRTKADAGVQLNLPAKVYQDQACEFSAEQTALYETVMEVILAEEVTGLSAFARRALFLKAILHAKQICIHPDLFYGDQDAGADSIVGSERFHALLKERQRFATGGETSEAVWLQRSGKLTALAELLMELKEAGRGILLFTQYLGAAKLVQRVARQIYGEDVHLPLLHGGLSSSQRQQLVDDFNDACRRRQAAAPILILSLKAGGTGLNLTGADRVVHLDRWWNPAVEDQATDRAHRFGQTQTVFVHTLTTVGTIEEAIARLFADKRQLTGDLLGTDQGGGVQSLLATPGGFLDLIDPQRLFSNRMLASGQLIKKEKG